MENTVHQLKFTNTLLDANAIISLPSTIPNIKRFVWSNKSTDTEDLALGDGGIKSSAEKEGISYDVFKNWQELEYFKEVCGQYQLYDLILGTTTFANLVNPVRPVACFW